MTTLAGTRLDVAAISERYFAAWAERDPEAIAALHTEDTMFWTRLGGGPVRGREAAQAAFAEIFEHFQGFGFEVHRLLTGDAHWTLDWRLTWSPGAGSVGFDCLDTVELSPEGLVARKDTFVDTVQLEAAMEEA